MRNTMKPNRRVRRAIRQCKYIKAAYYDADHFSRRAKGLYEFVNHYHVAPQTTITSFIEECFVRSALDPQWEHRC